MGGHNELFCKNCVGTNTHKMKSERIAVCDKCGGITYVPSDEGSE